jgi:hypothetical protein
MAVERCATERQVLIDTGSGHLSRCHRHADVTVEGEHG